jgi:hypothetical protein
LNLSFTSPLTTKTYAATNKVAKTSLQKAHTKALDLESTTRTDAEDTLSHATSKRNNNTDLPNHHPILPSQQADLSLQLKASLFRVGWREANNLSWFDCPRCFVYALRASGDD